MNSVCHMIEFPHNTHIKRGNTKETIPIMTNLKQKISSKTELMTEIPSWNDIGIMLLRFMQMSGLKSLESQFGNDFFWRI